MNMGVTIPKIDLTTNDAVRHLRIEDFSYELPPSRIAKHPLTEREACKLLVFRGDGEPESHVFSEVSSLLPEGAMLVYNNTRVINARVRLQKPTGATIEIFCLEPVRPHDYELIFKQTRCCTWLCLIGNNKRWKEGYIERHLTVCGNETTLRATRGERKGNAYEILFEWSGGATFAEIIESAGVIPIPPYLNRDTEASDADDYQTVYSRIDGSVAAPTAGLHFTPGLLEECDRKGIARRELTLHVGAGTFQPVKTESIGEHVMHHEFIAVGRELLAELAELQRPLIAVGTTSVRTLESLYYVGQTLEANPQASHEQLTVKQWMPYSTPCEISTKKALQNIVAYLDRNGSSHYIGSTQLLIAPGFRYRLVDGIITNFHQPQSTLLLLVAALVGQNRWKGIYDFALSNDYRFLSYGDACLLMNPNPPHSTTAATVANNSQL